MKIIYHCYGGSHSSVTAAGIHLGLLPADENPTRKLLEQIPYFDQQVSIDHGHLRLMGKDEYGNEVYIVGRRNSQKAFENVINGMAEIFDVSDQIYLVNCMPYVNWKMVVGGYTSRKLGMVKIGRPIIVSGIRFAFLKLVNLVNNVKVQVASNEMAFSNVNIL